MARVKELSKLLPILLALNYPSTLNSRLYFFIIILHFIFPVVILNHCPKSYFKIAGMLECHPWLNCTEIRKIKIMENIGYGTVKNVFKSIWRDHYVAVSVLKHEKYLSDFSEGLRLLKLFNPNPNVVQLIGFCLHLSIVVTEYHVLNNAINLRYLVKDQISALKFCMNYAEIMKFLHENREGKFVNCDSNSLFKLLSQFLITYELKIVLADLDSVQKVTNSNVICGSSTKLDTELHNVFLPPEQINFGWYNDKSEIWKVPEVCEFFVNSAVDNDIVKYLLFDLHKSCKNDDPQKRPTVKDLIKEYKKAFDFISEQ